MASGPNGLIEIFPSRRSTISQAAEQTHGGFHREIEFLLSVLNSYRKEAVFHHLLYSAEDIFLWIHIVIKELRNIRYVSRESVQNVLNETPQALGDYPSSGCFQRA
ncbi:hypothetical protein V2G26_019282 [Clonostachys chloroleuca]